MSNKSDDLEMRKVCNRMLAELSRLDPHISDPNVKEAIFAVKTLGDYLHRRICLLEGSDPFE